MTSRNKVEAMPGQGQTGTASRRSHTDEHEFDSTTACVRRGRQHVASSGMAARRDHGLPRGRATFSISSCGAYRVAHGDLTNIRRLPRIKNFSATNGEFGDHVRGGFAEPSPRVRERGDFHVEQHGGVYVQEVGYFTQERGVERVSAS